jgi:YbgC/YbaW family acyl-CoA thioester hydrolase
MNLYLRLLWMAVFVRFRSPVEPLGPCWTRFRVNPADLDLFMHMNNGRYFTIFDLARIDYMVRCGLYRKVRAKGWYPVVVSETITFRKPLKLFQAFDVESRILGWDDKAVLLQHRIVRGGEEITRAVIRARFLKKSGGTVAPGDLADLAGLPSESPELEESVRRWNEDQRAMRSVPRLEGSRRKPLFDTAGEELYG